MKTDNIDSIPAASYEGYVWLSNATIPAVIDGYMEELKLDPSDNPFIIEARLYNPQKRLSYSIKYVDGKYVALCHDLNVIEGRKGVVGVTKEFLPHRMPEIEILKFKQFWCPVADSLCDNMEVLTPAGLVFFGFKHKKLS